MEIGRTWFIDKNYKMGKIQQETSNRITILGFIMTCIIVLYHSKREGQLSPVSEIDAAASIASIKFIDQLASVAMYYFFSVTGYLLFHNYNRKTCLIKIRKRINTLLLPYIIWQVLYAISWKTDITVFVKTVFFFQEWPPDGPLWYLYAAFFLAVLSPFIYPVLRKRYLGLFLFGVISITVFELPTLKSIFPFDDSKYGYLPNIVSYFPAFYLGAFFSIQKDIALTPDERRRIICIMSFCAVIIDGVDSGFLINYTLTVLPIVLIDDFPVIKYRPCTLLDISFLMYSIHLFVIDKYGTTLRIIFFNIVGCKSLAHLGTSITLLCMTAFSAYAIKLILSILSPKALYILTGGRTKPMKLKWYVR